jgi:hypothetical protein
MNLRHVALGVLPLAALAIGAPAAGGQTDGKDTLSFAFTTAKAKSAAGYSIEAEFPQRRVIDQITISFPAGTKMDTSAVARCDADAARTEGANVADVCPPASKIGTGKGTAYLGEDPNPVTFDLGVYNTKGGAVLDIMLGGKTAFSAPIAYSGRKQVVNLGLTPSLGARITAFELDIKRAGTAKKPVFRTPATCPKSRKLTASLAAREDGAGTKTTSDTTACRR